MCEGRKLVGICGKRGSELFRGFWALLLSVVLTVSMVPVGALQAYAETLDADAAEQGEASGEGLDGADAGSGSDVDATGDGASGSSVGDSIYSEFIDLLNGSGDEGDAGSASGDSVSETADETAVLSFADGVAAISEGGVYYVPEGAGGTIVVTTTDAVTIIGNGVRWDDSFSITSTPNAELQIDCTQAAGANLTLKSLHITNDACAAAAPMISFAGEGNVLNIEGTVLLEQAASETATFPVVSVPQGAGLTVGGTGYLYMYGASDAAVVGGGAGAMYGGVTFGTEKSELTVFGRAAGAGALVGAGANVAQGAGEPGAIDFVEGAYNLVAAGAGAALGCVDSSAAKVNVAKRACVSVSVAGAASAVAGDIAFAGGSFRTYVAAEASSVAGYAGRAYGFGLSDLAVLGARTDAAGNDVYKCVVDTEALGVAAENLNVTVDGVTAYEGGLHCYGWAQEFIDGGETLSITTTPSNWYGCDDSCLFLYLTGEDHLVTVNGRQFVATYDADAAANGTAYTAGAFALEPFEAGALEETQQIDITLRVTLNGEDVTDMGLVTFTDPAQDGATVTEMSIEAGTQLALGIAVNDLRRYEIESAHWQHAPELVDGYPLAIDLGNLMVLQEDGTYLSDTAIGNNAIIEVVLVEREAAASAAASAGVGGEVTLLNKTAGDAESAEAVYAVSGDTITVQPEAYQGYYLAQVRYAVVPEEEAAEGSGGEAGEESGEASGEETGSESDGTAADAASDGASNEDSSGDAEGSEGTEGTEEEAAPLAFTVLQPANDEYSFTMPESGRVVVYVDFVSVAWDGTIDVTWYDPAASSFNISYAAQYAGLAAIVNGYFTTYPTKVQAIEGSTLTADVPDYDAYKAAMGVVEETTVNEDGEEVTSTVSSEWYGEFTATYKLTDSQVSYDTRTAAITKTTRVVGNPDYVVLNADSGKNVNTQNLRTSNTYYYGRDDFANKRVEIAADLDFGAWKENGRWSTSSPLFMPVGGQFAMLPGMDSTNGYSILGSSWNGVLDGNGHSFSNVYCERYASGGNYGDSVAIGLVGRMGNHDDEVTEKLAKDPTVRCIVFESGYISGRRSVGGIVGKTGQTTASKLGDGSTGCIVEYCINKADVITTDKKGVGGIVGAAWNSGVIRYCANFGAITNVLSGGSTAGGIAGQTEMLIMNCYNAGEVKADNVKYACGISTYNGGAAAMLNCYWLDDKSSTDDIGGGFYMYTFENEYNKEGNTYGNGSFETASELTAAMLNTSSEVWRDGSTGANGGYPVLFYQEEGYSSADEFTVSIGAAVDTEGNPVEATVVAEPAEGGFADTVSLSCSYVDPNYILDHYTLTKDGKTVALDVPSFCLDGDCTVGAVFREKKSMTAWIPQIDYYREGNDIDGELYQLDKRVTTLTVKKDGVAYNEETGQLEYVKGCEVEDGDTLYEGDVLSYGVTVNDGVTPTDPLYEYGSVFTVENFSYNTRHSYFNWWWASVYADTSVTYKVTGDEESLGVYVVWRSEVRRSWSTLADTSWYDAKDVQESYEISSAEQLAGVAKLVNEGTETFEGITLSLTEDISLIDERISTPESLSSARVWTPIGSGSYAFEGTFEGNGHVISGMQADTTIRSEYVGLFGNLDGATARSLTVEGTVEGLHNVGGVVGNAKASTIENCVSRVLVKATDSGKQYYYIGGVAGRIADGTTVRGCSHEADVLVAAENKAYRIGGVVGYAVGDSSIESCTNSGAVSLAGASTGYSAGGIVGEAVASTALGCANSGVVTGPAEGEGNRPAVGGVAGAIDGSAVVQQCANTGAVDAAGDGVNAGGVVGKAAVGSVADCYNTAVVSARTASNSNNDNIAGGILGVTYGTSGASIQDSYNAGAVTGNTAGAVVGRVVSKLALSNVLYDESTASKWYGIFSKAADGVEGLSSDDLKQTAATLDRERGVWLSDELSLNGGFPVLASHLPYRLVFMDTWGEKLHEVAIPAGYSATNETVSALFSSESVVPENLPDGYSYEFAFWASELNGTEPLTIENASGNVEAWPSFSKTLETYTIEYDLAGGENAEGNPTSYTVEDSIKLADPTREGWRFLYWTDESGQVVQELSGNVTGNLKLTANWTDSDICVVSYWNSKGEQCFMNYEIGSTILIDRDKDVAKSVELTGLTYDIPRLTDVEPDAGYETVGYEISPYNNLNFEIVSGNPITYAVSYAVPEGVAVPAANPAEYNVETSVTLTAATRAGYEFLGWYDADGKKWDAIPRGTTGDLAFEARWARDLSTAVVTGAESHYEYTGLAIEPALTVTHDGTVLTEGEDYALSYEDCTEVGLASVRITGMGDDATGVKVIYYVITEPQLTDSASGITAAGTDLVDLRQSDGRSDVTLELSAKKLSFSESATLENMLAGYALHAAFDSELIVTKTYADGSYSEDVVTGGFGTLTLTVPVSNADDGDEVAVYWTSGSRLKYVETAVVTDGKVSFETDTLGRFAVVSFASVSDGVDDEVKAEVDGSGDSNGGGVAVKSESNDSSGGTASKKSSATTADSAAGTVDDLSSEASSAGSNAKTATSNGGECDGCIWCAGPLSGLCDDFCSDEAPCAWCKAGPVAALLALAGVGVALWAVWMRFGRKPKDDDYGF